MTTHYYLSVSPVEALIASQLTPTEFGSYMATGSKNGSHERIIFIEIEGNFGDYFDWNYARERCVVHSDGQPKHSLWLSVYRVLENVPNEVLGSLYLTTKDGRTLELSRGELGAPPKRDFWVYQELCPLTPLVVSSLPPAEFCAFLTAETSHVRVPKVLIADLKVVDFSNLEDTGNIGAAYDRNIEHLKDCVEAVTTNPDKPAKNVERSVNAFGYQIISSGIYVGSGSDIVFYPMPSTDEIRRDHYDWGRSAMII